MAPRANKNGVVAVALALCRLDCSNQELGIWVHNVRAGKVNGYRPARCVGSAGTGRLRSPLYNLDSFKVKGIIPPFSSVTGDGKHPLETGRLIVNCGNIPLHLAPILANEQDG